MGGAGGRVRGVGRGRVMLQVCGDGGKGEQGCHAAQQAKRGGAPAGVSSWSRQAGGRAGGWAGRRARALLPEWGEDTRRNAPPPPKQAAAGRGQGSRQAAPGASTLQPPLGQHRRQHDGGGGGAGTHLQPPLAGEVALELQLPGRLPATHRRGRGLRLVGLGFRPGRLPAHRTTPPAQGQGEWGGESPKP